MLEIVCGSNISSHVIEEVSFHGWCMCIDSTLVWPLGAILCHAISPVATCNCMCIWLQSRCTGIAIGGCDSVGSICLHAQRFFHISHMCMVNLCASTHGLWCRMEFGGILDICYKYVTFLCLNKWCTFQSFTVLKDFWQLDTAHLK